MAAADESRRGDGPAGRAGDRPQGRVAAAKYYDLAPSAPDDVPFYLELISSPAISVLELGCGTGRVLIPLAEAVRRIVGVDHSRAMMEICRSKLASVGFRPPQVALRRADVSSVRLGERFDLVIAPFRVMQNLETDEQVDGLLATVRAHLGSGGSAVLNVFNPDRGRADLIRSWCTPGETLAWEVPVPGGRLACWERKPRLDPDRMVLYPEFVYRRYEGSELAEETVLPLVMRCYYAEEFEALITRAGFEVMSRWGGYHGEAYGVGPELVLQFRDARR